MLHFKIVSRLVLWIQAYYMVNSRCFLNIIIIYDCFYPESISFTLFMINKVNVTLFRQFLGLYCVCKLIIRFTHDVFLISLLFRIVSNMNHIHLPLLMINKVNEAVIWQFLGFYCLSMFIIRLTHDVFLISLLFRIVSSLNQFHLPQFMINKVNITLLRQFRGLFGLCKLIIRLTHVVF